MLCAREDSQRFPWEAAAPWGLGCLIFTGFIFQKYPIFQLFFKENEVFFPLLSEGHISHAANMFSFVFWQLHCEAEQQHSRALFWAESLFPGGRDRMQGSCGGLDRLKTPSQNLSRLQGLVGMFLMRVPVESP